MPELEGMRMSFKSVPNVLILRLLEVLLFYISLLWLVGHRSSLVLLLILIVVHLIWIGSRSNSLLGIFNMDFCQVESHTTHLLPRRLLRLHFGLFRQHVDGLVPDLDRLRLTS